MGGRGGEGRGRRKEKFLEQNRAGGSLSLEQISISLSKLRVDAAINYMSQ